MKFYTDIHPITGHRIQPGDGAYVRLDDLRYVEDSEEGTYIKRYQNVGDKPTTAVDASFRLRLQPRLFLARRTRNQFNAIRTQATEQTFRTQTTPAITPKPVDNKQNPFTWVFQRPENTNASMVNRGTGSRRRNITLPTSKSARFANPLRTCQSTSSCGNFPVTLGLVLR